MAFTREPRDYFIIRREIRRWENAPRVRALLARATGTRQKFLLASGHPTLRLRGREVTALRSAINGADKILGIRAIRAREEGVHVFSGRATRRELYGIRPTPNVRPELPTVYRFWIEGAKSAAAGRASLPRRRDLFIEFARCTMQLTPRFLASATGGECFRKYFTRSTCRADGRRRPAARPLSDRCT